ncbi:hypothetical protein V496_06011, partial [Pseudogymnoascus sp. VKM F-4515 (FW-2607)]
ARHQKGGTVVGVVAWWRGGGMAHPAHSAQQAYLTDSTDTTRASRADRQTDRPAHARRTDVTPLSFAYAYLSLFNPFSLPSRPGPLFASQPAGAGMLVVYGGGVRVV